MFSGILGPMSLFWLAAMLIFAVVEGLTVGLVSIWFAAGSLVALLAAAAGAPVWLQLVLFFAVTIVLLLLLRPFSRKLFSSGRTATNADRNIGSEAIVTERISNLEGTGAVKVNGLEWSARTVDQSVLEPGTIVIVREIEGVKLRVSLPEG